MLDPRQVRAAEASASPNQSLYPPQEPSAVRDPAVSAMPLNGSGPRLAEGRKRPHRDKVSGTVGTWTH